MGSDINSDIVGDIVDRGEAPSDMEPMLLEEGSRHRKALTDLAFELAEKNAGFHKSLPAGMAVGLSNLVRAMNCYYSNLIEGHNTHPVDIERALRNEYSNDKDKRNLQLEAKAHIEVQRWIDAGGLHGNVTTVAAIQEIHARFCRELPDEMLWIEDPITHDRMPVVPGQLRHHDVKVGHHIPISPGAIPRFLDRFETVFQDLGKTESILATAAAHHRLLWIHPFLDGNGRVARLMSHAMFLETLDTGALWSIARGLARSVEAYKGHLAECDQARRNHLDGRGALSSEALAAFTHFFLRTCIDQVTFMEGLMQPNQLRARILLWVEEEARLKRLHRKTGAILEALLFRGEIPRNEIPHLLNTGTRQAQRIVADLAKLNVITSQTPLGPIRMKFPAELAPRWMPNLFPPKPHQASITGDAHLIKNEAG